MRFGRVATRARGKELQKAQKPSPRWNRALPLAVSCPPRQPIFSKNAEPADRKLQTAQFYAHVAFKQDLFAAPSKRLALARVATYAEGRLLRTVMGNSVSINPRFDSFGSVVGLSAHDEVPFGQLRRERKSS